ncbi:hypothetical protein A7976_10715 [Methylobacillus sp. MM3]|uniref:NnrS family protein n=1 Tax=Methylobacillus sp. MM3 TaxID=1848039 RepID=UPI0007E12F12|nr:NnrS family protein [Methylobacillus sp. MM3]OAJ71912.1 hypothetical protein A7976_10715 [Methylobacillus sp. MM3]
MKQKTWVTFSAAPHRMFFFGGVLQSVLVMAWWLADLAGRYGGFYPPIAWSVAPPDAHAFLMLYGFFPFLIFGFLMTTYPRWLNGEEVGRRYYVPGFLLMFAGVLAFYAGLVWGGLLAFSALLFLAGWGVSLAGLLRVYFRAQHPDKRHPRITSTMLAIGWLLAAGWFAGQLGGFALPVALTKSGGVWLFLLPIFFAISHRMIPFFSANVIPDYRIVRPGWALTLMPAAALLHMIFEVAGLAAWLWLPDLAIAVAALYMSWAWRLRASFAQPLLAMLHIGFAWLGVALLFYGVQSLALLAGHVIFAKAPLHALVIGYFSSMVLGMISRVTLGHSGRPLVADRLTWGIFLAFQSVLVLRVIADVPDMAFVARSHLYLCAAVVWLACFGIWAYRNLPIYVRPRLDGNPG